MMSKKRLLVLGAVALIATSLMGCGEDADTKLSDINPDKYVTLGDYKGITVSFGSIEVTDDMIQQQIDSALDSQSTEKDITDRAVKDGDIVNIDYAGSIDGVAFEGGTASGNDLIIGSGTMIPGFEEGIVGMKVGEKKDIDVPFPENYGKAELAGKNAVFAISVNSIKEKVVPELSDEVVAKIDPDCKTVEDYKQKVHDQLETSLKTAAESSAFSELFSKACDNATVKKIPDWLLEDKKTYIQEGVEKYAQQYGMDVSQFLQTYMGQTQEQFEKEKDNYAKTGAEQSLITYALAKAEGLELSEQELEDAITTYAQQSGVSNEDFKKGSDMLAFEEYILKSKIQNMLFENANFVDADGNAVDASYISTSANEVSENAAK